MAERAFEDVLESILTARAERVRTWLPGRVRRFNATTKLAEVEPLVVLEEGRRLPVLPNVRVAFVGGAYWDLQPGETGIILIGWLDWRGWRRSGNPSAPEDEGLHELDYATFLPGLWDDSTANAADLDAGAKVIAAGDLRLGSADADKAAVHEALLSALKTFLEALDLWGALVGTAAGIPWTGPPADVQTALRAITTGITAESYQSPSVKVED